MYNDSYGFLGLLTGGLGIFILIVYIFINTILTGWLAGQKGYSVGSWVALSLFFGPIAFLTLGFAPNLNTEATLRSIKKNLESQNIKNTKYNKLSTGNSSTKPYSASAGPKKRPTKPWFCKKCNTTNKISDNTCKSCGEYR